MGAPHLRANPGSGRSGGQRESTLPDHWSEPRRILPFSALSGVQASEHDSAEPDPAYRLALAGVWLSARARPTGASGLEGQSQTHSASDAQRQLTLCAAAEVPLHHRLATWLAHLSKLNQGPGR